LIAFASAGCTATLNVVFLVDISGSLAYDGYYAQIAFMDEIVQGLSFSFQRTQVALVTFAAQAQVVFFLDTYNSPLDILNAISIDTVDSGTDFSSGFNLVTNSVIGGSANEVGKKNVVIFLSDGKLNLDMGTFDTSVDTLKATGATIYAISVGPSVQQDTMNYIASNPSTMYTFAIPLYNETDVVANAVLDQLCQLSK